MNVTPDCASLKLKLAVVAMFGLAGAASMVGAGGAVALQL